MPTRAGQARCPARRDEWKWPQPKGSSHVLCSLLTQLRVQGSDAREMVMMSLVHEHNRSMNAHHAAKRARIAAGHVAPQPQFAGACPLPHTIRSVCIRSSSPQWQRPYPCPLIVRIRLGPGMGILLTKAKGLLLPMSVSQAFQRISDC